MKNKKTYVNLKMVFSVFLLILFIAILALVILLVLSNFTSQIYEQCCKAENGTFLFYECHEPPVFSDGTPCKDLKTGFFCLLPNGTEIKTENLSCILNITNGESAG